MPRTKRPVGTELVGHRRGTKIYLAGVGFFRSGQVATDAQIKALKASGYALAPTADPLKQYPDEWTPGDRAHRDASLDERTEDGRRAHEPSDNAPPLDDEREDDGQEDGNGDEEEEA